MRYGVHLGGAAALRTVDGVKQIGELAEELGYDGIVTGDHITIPKQISSAYPYTKFSQKLGADPYAVFTTIDWLDGFTVLALLIPVTKKIRLGTSVTIVIAVGSTDYIMGVGGRKNSPRPLGPVVGTRQQVFVANRFSMGP